MMTFAQKKKFMSPLATKHLAKEGKLHGGKFLPIKKKAPQIPIWSVDDAEYCSLNQGADLLGMTIEGLTKLIVAGVVGWTTGYDMTQGNIDFYSYGGYLNVQKVTLVSRADIKHLQMLEEEEMKSRQEDALITTFTGSGTLSASSWVSSGN